MGGPGSGRRPRALLELHKHSDRQLSPDEELHKRIIYPLLLVEGEAAAIISSDQEGDSGSYQTYALGEIAAKGKATPTRGWAVNMTMLRFEPDKAGMISTMKTIPGVIQNLSEEVRDGYQLALIALRDEVKYEMRYQIYDPSLHQNIRPLDQVYCIGAGRTAFPFTIDTDIIKAINFPVNGRLDVVGGFSYYHLSVDPCNGRVCGRLVVHPAGADGPVLLSIAPRWDHTTIREFLAEVKSTTP